MTSQPHPSNSAPPAAPFTFTVRVELYMHVTLEVPYEGHPDFVDTEAIERALEAHLERGEPAHEFRGATVDYATTSAEAESWHR